MFVTTISFLSLRLGFENDLGINHKAVPNIHAQYCLVQRRTYFQSTQLSKSVYEKVIMMDLCLNRVYKTIDEHIELPAKLLDYFLRSNKSNINQDEI